MCSSDLTLALDPDTGWALEGAVGVHVGDLVRLEASLGYGRNALNGNFAQNVQAFVPCGELVSNPCLAPNDDGSMRTFTGFGMAYAGIPTGMLISPYIGAGIGFVRADLGVGTQGRLNADTASRFAIVDAHNTVLGYRATASVSRSFGAAQLSIGYTFTRTGALNLPGRGPLVSFTFDRPMTTHGFNAGVAYKF